MLTEKSRDGKTGEMGELSLNSFCRCAAFGLTDYSTAIRRVWPLCSLGKVIDSTPA